MEIDVSLDQDSLSIPIENPYALDMNSLMDAIERFVSSRGAALDGLEIEGLIPGMVKGIAGCERGCPADALGFVRRGYGGFKLSYVEGGILTATATISGGRNVSIRVFPDF